LNFQKECCAQGLNDAWRFISTVHDEINFTVKTWFLCDFMRIVPKLMTLQMPGWEVPLTVETEIGENWLRLIKYKYDESKKIFLPKGQFIEKVE
jgi:DNA polymerase I-like protein with 3'-5' exonuclease and polymerase domains